MKVGADASQVPAIVRHIRGQKGATWKDKVKSWQRQHGGLKVDGIVGPKTIAAMKGSDSNYENNDYKQKATPTIDPLIEPRGKGTGNIALRNARARREAKQKQNYRNTSADMQNRLKNISQTRYGAANQNLNFLSGRKLQEAIYERRRGGESVTYKRPTLKSVSSKKGPQRPDYLGTPRSSTTHKSRAATLKNLNKAERAAFERWYQQYRRK